MYSEDSLLSGHLQQHHREGYKVEKGEQSSVSDFFFRHLSFASEYPPQREAQQKQQQQHQQRAFNPVNRKYTTEPNRREQKKVKRTHEQHQQHQQQPSNSQSEIHPKIEQQEKGGEEKRGAY
ncbi:AT-rich binding protein-like [Drosophila persimilis]|uniref:AT-rich binding protein-like n=1 Tax=Drosophila persimilis TaxID=7234 RepID=UPI000F07960E|nr:AT-rich binding protein-like [Drosophila persimilis]